MRSFHAFAKIFHKQVNNSTKKSCPLNRSDIAITAKHLTLQYRNKSILDDVSLDIYSGEVTALLGPNGTGKSSLLKLLCGEMSLTQQSNSLACLNYFGQPSSNWDKQILARHLGMLPQHSTLSFPFLVEEVVELGGLPLNVSKAELSQIACEKMELVGILSMAKQMYPQLSGGEKQRVHLARVLTQLHYAQSEQIFMLDEPTSALDLAHQHNTLRLAQDMARKGTAVVVVLHDLNLAAQYADRILLLNNGTIISDGSAWQTLTASNIDQVYGQKTILSPHPEYGFPVIMPA